MKLKYVSVLLAAVMAASMALPVAAQEPAPEEPAATVETAADEEIKEDAPSYNAETKTYNVPGTNIVLEYWVGDTTISGSKYVDGELIDYEYTIGGAHIAGCNSDAEGKLVIPDEIEGNPVTTIDCSFKGFNGLEEVEYGGKNLYIGENYDGTTWLFAQCENLKKVTIREGTRQLYTDEFESCLNLETVELPDSVEKIGYGAFYDCPSLKSIKLPASLKKLEGGTFMGCQGLKKIIFQDGIESVTDNDFSGCRSLETVSIGKSFAKLEINGTGTTDNPFYHCKSLKEITVDPENPYYYSDDGILFDKASEKIVAYPAAKEGDSYSLPKSVTTIAYGAFAFNKNLVSLTLPDGLKEIDTHAFREVEKMENLDLPESVQEIKAGAIHNSDTVKTLTKVTVYGKNTALGENSLGMTWDAMGDSYTVDANAVIYGYKNSTAQTYAKNTGVRFRDLEGNVEPENGWYTDEDGKEYWYENGVRQGTEGRGKEIYDPDSDAWYWLDANQGGAKAVSKDVYQETNGGKWVRYDAEGHMIKGWQTTDAGTYYFDPVTGAMAHGDVVVDDLPCSFDETSGIGLNQKWKTQDGKDYWYESGKRQGYDPHNAAYRGKEIYDPASDAWYWLDNVQQGAKAVSKDVYQESEAGQWADRPDGTGKWVRYDAGGHMIKGWSQDHRYYFDPIYGTMAKGTAVIDGRTYNFDPNTGVLK